MGVHIVQEDSDLLQALRPEDRALLAPHLEDLWLAAGNVIYRPGDLVEFCYLPRGAAACSCSIKLDNGTEVETILVGREGALGGVVSMGHLPAFGRSVVLHAGRFWRISTRQLDEIKARGPAIANLFARYADCAMAQVFQSIACNSVHTIEQRAARWLGAAVDRVGRDDVTMTQEQLAAMMGIGRSYASRVVQRFKREGLLRTRRGGITILDRAGLADKACSCNDQVRGHFDRVLEGVYPRVAG